MRFERVRWPDRPACRKVDPAALEAILATAEAKGEGVKISIDRNDTWHKAYNRYRDAVQRAGYDFMGMTAADGGLIMRAIKSETVHSPSDVRTKAVEVVDNWTRNL